MKILSEPNTYSIDGAELVYNGTFLVKESLVLQNLKLTENKTYHFIQIDISIKKALDQGVRINVFEQGSNIKVALLNHYRGRVKSINNPTPYPILGGLYSLQFGGIVQDGLTANKHCILTVQICRNYKKPTLL